MGKCGCLRKGQKASSLSSPKSYTSRRKKYLASYSARFCSGISVPIARGILKALGSENSAEGRVTPKPAPSRDGLPQCNPSSLKCLGERASHIQSFIFYKGGECGCGNRSLWPRSSDSSGYLSAGCSKEVEYFLWLMQTNFSYTECSAAAKVFSGIFHVVA